MRLPQYTCLLLLQLTSQAACSKLLPSSSLGVHHTSFLVKIGVERPAADKPDPRPTDLLHLWTRCYSDSEVYKFSGFGFLESSDQRLHGILKSALAQSRREVTALTVSLRNGTTTIANFHADTRLQEEKSYAPFRLTASLPISDFTEELEIAVTGGGDGLGTGLLRPELCLPMDFTTSTLKERVPALQRPAFDPDGASAGLPVASRSGVVFPPIHHLATGERGDKRLTVLLKHAHYHLKCLQMGWYILYVKPQHWPYMQRRLGELVGDSDLLDSFLFVEWSDLTHDPKQPFNSQVLSVNHALLALEGLHQYALMIDHDEYLVTNRGFSAASLPPSALRLSRTNVVGDINAMHFPVARPEDFLQPSPGFLDSSIRGFNNKRAIAPKWFFAVEGVGEVIWAVHTCQTAIVGPHPDHNYCFHGHACDLQMGKRFDILHFEGLFESRFAPETEESWTDIERLRASGRDACASARSAP